MKNQNTQQLPEPPAMVCADCAHFGGEEGKTTGSCTVAIQRKALMPIRFRDDRCRFPDAFTTRARAYRQDTEMRR